MSDCRILALVAALITMAWLGDLTAAGLVLVSDCHRRVFWRLDTAGRAVMAGCSYPHFQVPPSFSSLLVGKSVESLVSFLVSMTYSENGKIFRTNKLHFAYCSTDYTLNAWCIQQSPAAS